MQLAYELGLSVNFMPIRKLFVYHYQRCAYIPGHLIVPYCFGPGRGTHTRDSGTVPGIPGQLVTLNGL